MKTLLSPAVLHFSMLEKLQTQNNSFIKKYLYRFALIQGIVWALLYIVFFSTVVFPAAKNITNIAEVILTHASFSRVKVQDGRMSMDIKPSIWTFTTKNTETYQYIVAVDTTGDMNPYYFDDRFVGGTVKRVEGVLFGPETVKIKTGNQLLSHPYSKYLGKRNVEMTKGEVLRVVQKYTSKESLTFLLVLTLPIVYVIAVLFGLAIHVGFALISGVLIAVITSDSSRYIKQAINVGTGLYVGWFYVISLLLLAQSIASRHIGTLDTFYAGIQGMLFMALVFIGYCSVRFSQEWSSPFYPSKASKVTSSKK